LKYKKFGLVCQVNLGHKMWDVMSMFVVRREFDSKRILNYIVPYESSIVFTTD